MTNLGPVNAFARDGEIEGRPEKGGTWVVLETEGGLGIAIEPEETADRRVLLKDQEKHEGDGAGSPRDEQPILA